MNSPLCFRDKVSLPMPFEHDEYRDANRVLYRLILSNALFGYVYIFTFLPWNTDILGVCIYYSQNLSFVFNVLLMWRQGRHLTKRNFSSYSRESDFLTPFFAKNVQHLSHWPSTKVVRHRKTDVVFTLTHYTVHIHISPMKHWYLGCMYILLAKSIFCV